MQSVGTLVVRWRTRRWAGLGSRRRFPLWASLLVLVGAAACTDPERGTRLVLVTLDTLRFDTLFGDAGSPSVMPRTLAWSGGAARFDAYFSVAPVTQPTHASLLTGMFPWEHGVTRNGLALADERLSVAEVLRDAGWDTGAVVASYPLTRHMGLDQGFGRYVDTLDRRVGAKWNGEDVEEFYSLGARVTDRAFELMEELDGKRQFLWVHYFDPHAPYGDTSADGTPLLLPKFMASVFDASSPAAARAAIARGRAKYDEDARSLDRELARLLAALAADESSFETHVVLVSDHGESFGEDGSLGHGKRLSPAQIAVPLVIRSARIAAGRRAESVGSTDVAATLLSLAGVGLRLPHGRDLLLAPSESSTGALGLVAGMRTSLSAPLRDPRLDGPERLLESDRWFVVLDGAIRAGDLDGVWTDDNAAQPAPPELAESARALFEIFAREGNGARALDDETTRAALEALGYAQ